MSISKQESLDIDLIPELIDKLIPDNLNKNNENIEVNN
jgi:hypothetical protein